MATERERKFIVDAIPPTEVLGTSLGGGTHLRQGYLAEENGVVLRVRIMSDLDDDAGDADSAVITIKAGGGLSRTEVEVAIPVEEAEQLWPHTAGRRLEKVRHEVPLGEHVAELDVYAGGLSGLLTVEVEFDSEEAAHRFSPPSWFGREVTDQPQWSNAALARDGVPSH